MFIQTRVWVYLCLSIRLSMLSLRTRRLVQVSVCVCVCGCVFHHHQDITRMHTLIGYPLQALSTLCCLICRKFCLRMPAPFWKSSPRCQRNHTSRKKPGGFLNVTGAKCKDGGNNPSFRPLLSGVHIKSAVVPASSSCASDITLANFFWVQIFKTWSLWSSELAAIKREVFPPFKCYSVGDDTSIITRYQQKAKCGGSSILSCTVDTQYYAGVRMQKGEQD